MGQDRSSNCQVVEAVPDDVSQCIADRRALVHGDRNTQENDFPFSGFKDSGRCSNIGSKRQGYLIPERG